MRWPPFRFRAALRGGQHRVPRMTQAQRVTFLYRAAHARSGSKIMRCDQLCAIARAHLGERFDFDVVELPRPGRPERVAETLDRLEGAVVILLKRAHLMLDDGQTESLRRRARAILIDHLDARLDARSLGLADVDIAASLAGAQALKDLAADPASPPHVNVALVTHHADPRIAWTDHRHATRLAIGYFGLPEHAAIPHDLEDRILLPDYRKGQGMEAVLAAIPPVNVHFAVRPGHPARNSRKPFTKGINAAAAGANVLVQRGVDDAVALLGEDYPFLIDSDAPDAVNEGVGRLEASLGTPTWHAGLDAMENLRAHAAPARVAQQLGSAIEMALDA